MKDRKNMTSETMKGVDQTRNATWQLLYISAQYAGQSSVKYVLLVCISGRHVGKSEVFVALVMQSIMLLSM